MIKNVAILRFWYEGNSFSPLPAGRAAFESREWISGDEARDFYQGKGLETGAAVDYLARHPGIDGQFLRCAAAYPAGPVAAGLFPAFAGEVISGLRGRQWDGIYASLHGATVAADLTESETHLLERIRAEVGSAPIAVSFDLHANLDPRIGDLADIVVGYKTYPHIDMYETGWKAMSLLHKAMQGEIRPRSLIRPAGFAPTSFNMRTAEGAGPMAAVVRRAARAEDEHGFHDVSSFGGFPYADVANCGASVSVCFDKDTVEADRVAVGLAEDFKAQAGDFDSRLPGPEEVIGGFLEGGQGVHWAILEPSDNVFSGGAGDTPGLLRAVLELVPQVPSVFAFFWDPGIATRAMEAGFGATLDCAFGGRLSTSYGDPVHVTGTVETLTDGRFENIGPMEKGLSVDLGATAVIRVGEVRIIVTSSNVPVNDPAYFALHGIDLASYPLVYVKAKNHFRAAFAEAFDRIVECETQGPAPSDLSGLPYTRAPLQRLKVGRRWKESSDGF